MRTNEKRYIGITLPTFEEIAILWRLRFQGNFTEKSVVGQSGYNISFISIFYHINLRDKINDFSFALSEYSDQPAHSAQSLNRPHEERKDS